MVLHQGVLPEQPEHEDQVANWPQADHKHGKCNEIRVKGRITIDIVVVLEKPHEFCMRSVNCVTDES